MALGESLVPLHRPDSREDGEKLSCLPCNNTWTTTMWITSDRWDARTAMDSPCCWFLWTHQWHLPACRHWWTFTLHNCRGLLLDLCRCCDSNSGSHIRHDGNSTYVHWKQTMAHHGPAIAWPSSPHTWVSMTNAPCHSGHRLTQKSNTCESGRKNTPVSQDHWTAILPGTHYAVKSPSNTSLNNKNCSCHPATWVCLK